MQASLLRMPCRPAFRRATRQLARPFVVACLVAMVVVPASAQDLRYLRHGSWSTENGLPQNSVQQILQTRDGFLWIATEGGVARFDGVAFKTFKQDVEPAFASNDTCCLAEGMSGDLWFGTSDGLVRLRQGAFRRFSREDGLPSTTILALHVTDRELLVQTSSGTSVQRGERFVPSAATLMDGAGSVDSVEKEPHGDVWAMSRTAVTLTTAYVTRRWTVAGDLPGSRVASLFVDRQGNAWVGTNDGLAVIKKGADHVEIISALRANSVLQTYQDREGNYWVGTESTGLHLLHAEVFRAAPHSADQELTAVVQGSNGDMWLGTRNDGLRHVHNGRFESTVPADALTSRFILSLAPGRSGDVWVGTPDGLNHIDGTGKVQRLTSADVLPDDYIRALAAGAGEAIWVGTRRGLVRLKGSTAKVFTRADGLGSDLIGALLYAANGDLWVGTSAGLSNLAPDGRVFTYTVNDGLLSPFVSAMAEAPAGTLWVATSDGAISRVVNHHVSTVQSSSLQAGTLADLLADRAGFMWMRGEHSILRVAVADLNTCAALGHQCDLRLNRYTTLDGIPSSEFVAGGSPSLWQVQDGDVWAVTQKGAAIAGGQPPSFTQPFAVVVERMLVDGTEQGLQHGPVSLAAGVIRIDMEYAALSYAAPMQVRYRYRLDGFDREWTSVGSRRTATYTNLPPRSYTFRVEAMNRDGTWVGLQTGLTFRVTPPLYRRWWFIVLAALLAAATAVSLFRLRLLRLRQQFAAVLGERNRMAREIHDTLAQDLVGVALQLDIVSQFLATGQPGPAARQVESTRKLVVDGLAEARRSIWNLRADGAKGSLPTRLAALVERYSGPPLTVTLQVEGAYRRLPVHLEEECLRIAQEALSNVQRHSGSTQASVRLHFGTTMLVLSVIDQGCGFIVREHASAQGHFGVSGMAERAVTLGATLLIDSAPGQGATVTLRAKIAGAEEKPV